LSEFADIYMFVRAKLTVSLMYLNKDLASTGNM